MDVCLLERRVRRKDTGENSDPGGWTGDKSREQQHSSRGAKAGWWVVCCSSPQH